MNRLIQSFSLRTITLIVGASVLTSCMTVGPNYQRPDSPLPSTWGESHGGDDSLVNTQHRASTRQVSMQEGFALFADETLLALQERALANSPDLQSALLRFAQSRVQLEGVRRQNQPLLRTSAGAARIAQSETGSATRLISAISSPAQSDDLIEFIAQPFAIFEAGFDASWELDFWGAIDRRVEAAQADVDIANANNRQMQLALLSEVARHYFSLRGTQQQLRLLRNDIERAQSLLALLQVRAQAGLNNDMDAVQQEARVAQAQSQMPALLAQEAQSINALSLLLGEAPGSLQLEESQWRLHAVPDLALGLPSDLVDARPDIQAAEAQLRAANAQIGAAQAKLYPNIMLGAGLGLESLNSDDLVDWGSRQWSIGPQIDLALFDQGQRKTVVRLRELQAQEAAINYQQIVLKAWHEVDTALSRYSAAQQTQQQLQALLASQQQAYEFALTQFNNGVINYLQVLILEQARADASKALSANEAEMAIGLVGLFKALGRSDGLADAAVAAR